MAVGVTIAALAVLFGGKMGGGKSISHFLIDAESEIKKTVQDKTRRKTILGELGKCSKALKKLEKRIEGHLKDYALVHADFQSTEDDFDAITTLLTADQQSASALILSTREAMREHMNAAEWNAVFQPQDNEPQNGSSES